MFDGKKADDQSTLEEMPETGGDVRASENPVQESGEKGGQALQEQQEQESYQEFEIKSTQEKGEQSSDSEDLWGEE